MTAPASSPWQALLSPNGFGLTETRRFRLVQRSGEPFLLLPLANNPAIRGLDLYPAQTGKARVLRAALRGLLGVGLAPGTQPVSVAVATESPLGRFLADGRRWDELQLAMLLGNPNAPGRRFVLLVMDEQGAPLHVVKAGTADQAVALIHKEAAFLQSQSAERLRSSQLRCVLRDHTVAAISLTYAAGQPPRSAGESKLAEVLGGWLHSDARLSFSSFPQAQRLLASPKVSPVERQLLSRLETHPIASAIHHGDFTPWNIREESDGRWTVLDWERGESHGPSAWDWFHFRVQTAVLAERLRPAAILERLESCLHQPSFQRYAKAANIEGLERELLLGYLLHARDVVQQTEGGETIQQLAGQLVKRLNAS